MSDNTPTAVVQQSLDAIGSDHLLGDIEDGAAQSQKPLRAYRQCLMQLLRSAPWAWARRQAPMTLLADASGNTPNVGTLVTDPNFVYMYSWPTDAMKIRYVPWQYGQVAAVPANNIQPANSSSPIVTGLGQPPYGPQRIRPARFLVSNDINYPPPSGGAQSWDVQGVSPQGRTVILTNVQNAQAVYTYLCLYPSVWDSLFRAALVAFIASETVMALLKDKKMAMELRTQQTAIAKDKILQARAASGNEGTNSVDIRVDWMDTRQVGGPNGWHGGWDGGGPGTLWGGYDDCCGAGVVSGAAF
jgi:hypothetical protein